jgi:hypothetical protein
VVSAPAVFAGQFRFMVSGDAGPDDTIQAATNLTPHAGWTTLLTTSPAQLPFVWTDTNRVNFPVKIKFFVPSFLCC